MGSPLVRAVAPHCGAPTWIARRSSGTGLARLCLAHRVSAEAIGSIERLRGLSHPHLGRTLGVARIEEQPYVLTALRPAESVGRLRDRLARAGRPGLPVPVMVRAVAEVAGAVAALHARGVTHGAVDTRRVAIEYGGRALLRDAALVAHRETSAADDVKALGRLITTVCVDLPGPVVDLAERIQTGVIERAADVAVALDAWRSADAKAGAVDDAKVAQWIRRVCAARFEVWSSVTRDEASGPRSIDALAVLLGAPRPTPSLPST